MDTTLVAIACFLSYTSTHFGICYHIRFRSQKNALLALSCWTF